MALDLTGINNENEFYTHHYLSAILENDLKDLFKKWESRKKEEGVRPPYAELRGIRQDYLRMRNRLERERSLERRLKAQQEFLTRLLAALGYEPKYDLLELDDDSLLPIACEIVKPDGSPELWVLEAVDPAGDGIDPLMLNLQPCQFPPEYEQSSEFFEFTFEDLLSRQIFGRSEPPRWIILVSDTQLLLLDRGKWNEKRLLRFELSELFGRNETSTLKATAALLHRESIVPPEGISLLDTLDENSHKHAFSVSEDLKYALREAIELLGNEAVWYLREKLHEKLYEKNLADDLTRECLRYMYRLMFLFYIEARPELEYASIGFDTYRKGYSLESLRDLEMVRLTTEKAQNGYYIHESLKLLFELIYNGFPPKEQYDAAQQTLGKGRIHGSFLIPPLRSHLFDPSRTPILNRVKFRNSVLQKVIKLMSLTRPQKGTKNNRRGRVSYAQLGINQLGAVYEALLSYRGFFAETDLYEVKKAKDKYNELETAYFVEEEDLPKYTEEERAYNPDGTLKKYPKGTFIYRLAGRNRQKSASYYTPEVLTKCLVKYALKELLKDKTADDILNITICEPAMGSAAFLNEAVNQLAEAYLERKQKETGITIPHKEYQREKQKVKMFLADNNVFGVDLNPVAVELAEVSLWLNTIYRGGYVPWFGMQLVTGNSLIGARRQVFDARLLEKRGKDGPTWLCSTPERISPGKGRPNNSVYHFLLPDMGMANYGDKVIKRLAGKEIAAIKEWRKNFIKPFGKGQIRQLLKLSEAVDRLFERHVKDLRRIRSLTTDSIHIFGQPKSERDTAPTTTEKKDRILNQQLYSKDVRNSSPYRRLKLAMDYWCALWFWPIEKAHFLPSREEFFLDLSLILEGNVLDVGGDEHGQLSMLPDTMPRQLALKMVDEFGFVNVDKLCRENPRLRTVMDLYERYRFLHWELEFADIFAERGGFDLVLGNPPWIKVEWNEGGVMSDKEPLFVLKKYSASRLAALRDEVMEKYNLKSDYLAAYEEADATQNFLNAYQNYSLLKGVQTNLYKCFLPQAWMIGREGGVSAFLHPEGIYDDPKGGRFREEVYPRLRYHFQFQNQLILFPIGHRERYSINIYKNEVTNCFVTVANLFHPSTVYACFAHDGRGPVPGIKNDDNKWDMRGHKDRIIQVSGKELKLFARLYDAEGTPPLQARLPALHSRQLISVLEKFAAQPRRLGDLKGEYFSTVMWDETNAVKRDGTIRRETCFPEQPSELILSGPHFFVGTPFYKTPRAVCTEKAHYDVLDLTELPDDYLPRTNYVPAVDPAEYRRRTPKVPWGDRKPVTEFYRLAFRGMIGSAAERTLIGAVTFPAVGHINGVQTTAFKSLDHLLQASFIGHSIVGDFYIKSTGRGNLHYIWTNLPLIQLTSEMQVRLLTLTCLTTHYSDLWSSCWQPEFTSDRWAKAAPRLPNSFFSSLLPTWNRNCALRTDYARRQALVEIDVLAAMALGLTLNELKTVYRVQFPVLRMYEADTWYDQNGRIVFTNSKGLTGIGFSRPEWNEIKGMKSGTVERTITDDTLPGGPRQRTITYVAPFDRCDRERDYEIVWAEFERRLKKAETV